MVKLYGNVYFLGLSLNVNRYKPDIKYTAPVRYIEVCRLGEVYS